MIHFGATLHPEHLTPKKNGTWHDHLSSCVHQQARLPLLFQSALMPPQSKAALPVAQAYAPEFVLSGTWLISMELMAEGFGTQLLVSFLTGGRGWSLFPHSPFCLQVSCLCLEVPSLLLASFITPVSSSRSVTCLPTISWSQVIIDCPVFRSARIILLPC